MQNNEMRKLITDPSDMIAGIYCYRDMTGKIIYIGKDSKLKFDNRHLGHLQIDSKNKAQLIDKVLRKNPSIYIYERITFCTKEWLEIIEELLIKAYKPRYNISLNKE